MLVAVRLRKQRLDPSHEEIVKAFVSSRDFLITKDRNSFFVCVKRPQEGVQQYKTRGMGICSFRR